MKPFILIAALLCFFAGKAQINNFCIGPKVGYSSNTLNVNVDSITSTASGNFNFGVFARFGGKTYIQPEVNYLMKSGKLKSEFNNIVTNEEIKAKGIEIPVLIGRKIIDRSILDLRVVAGPSVTFLIKDSKQVKISDLNSSWPITSTDDLKDALWSLNFGAGIDVWFVTFDVHYQLGLTNIYNGSAPDTKFKSNCWNISLGIKLL